MKSEVNLSINMILICKPYPIFRIGLIVLNSNGHFNKLFATKNVRCNKSIHNKRLCPYTCIRTQKGVLRIDYITMEEMSKILRVSKATLSRYCEKGLPHLKVSSHHLLFDKQQVLSWIASNGKGKSNKPTASFDYRNVLIAPLKGQNSIDWYNGQNKLKHGTRVYITNQKAAVHVNHISYFAGIINKQIKDIDLIVNVSHENLAKYGYDGFGPVLTLERGFALNNPIFVTSRSGPGYSLNCLDIILNNQGQNLSNLTKLKESRMAKFPAI